MLAPWQRTITVALVGLALLTALPARPAPAQQTDTLAIRLATAATTAWLQLVDDGRYEDSWEAAAATFQQAVSKAAWSQALAQVRGPFEPFGERTLLGAKYVETLPNAPPGPYVIIQYRTKVRGGREVIETITPARTGPDTWQVSGYFVKPA